jgi:hypothetical protein
VFTLKPIRRRGNSLWHFMCAVTHSEIGVEVTSTLQEVTSCGRRWQLASHILRRLGPRVTFVCVCVWVRSACNKLANRPAVGVCVLRGLRGARAVTFMWERVWPAGCDGRVIYVALQWVKEHPLPTHLCTWTFLNKRRGTTDCIHFVINIIAIGKKYHIIQTGTFSKN